MNKKDVYRALREYIAQKLNDAHLLFKEASDSVQAETKSTAGDKHETGRAMAQIEMEKAGKHFQEILLQEELINQLRPEVMNDKVVSGALVHTTQGYFYISSGIGKLQADNQTVFCIGLQSPVGKALFNKKEGDQYTAAGNTHTILSVF